MDNSIIKSTTGWEFVDSLLRGGHRNGKTYGILCPSGGGRTTLATMIAAKGAQREFQRCQADAGKTPGAWILFSPGQSSDQIAYKAMALLEKLSLPFKSEAPNRQMQASDDTDRIGKIFETVGRHLVVPDDRLSLVANTGWTLIEPVCRVIEACARTGFRIAGVVIDDPKHILPSDQGDYRVRARNLLRLVYECQVALAEKWNCPVWLTHPLVARKWTANWKAKFSADDAQECRRFADHLDALFILGPHEKPSGRFRLHLAKGGLRNVEPKTMIFDKCGTFIRETVEGEFREPERKTPEFEVFSESARRTILEFSAQQKTLPVSKAIVTDVQSTKTSEVVKVYVTAVDPDECLAAVQEQSSVAAEPLRELLFCT